MSSANFTCNGSPSSARGYVATAGAALALQLEDQPALDVQSCVYSIVGRSKGAPALTLPNGGIPSTPAAALTVPAMPARPLGRHAYAYRIRCQINGGKAVPGASGKPDWTVTTKDRIVVVRSAVADVRKVVPGETQEFDPTNGWTDLLNDLADAVEDVAASLEGASDGLTPTATKVADYTATLGELVLYDPGPSSGTIVLTMPTAVGHDGARVGVHNATDSPLACTVVAADGIDGRASVVLVEPRGTLVLRAKGDTWHTDWRHVPRELVVPLLVGMRSTTATSGAPEELGGAFVHLDKLAWATKVMLRVYLRTSDGAQLAHADLYDSDGAVHLAPSSLGAVNARSTMGVEQEVDVTELLTLAGGSGFGWLQLRAWSDGGGASAIVGRADLIIT